MSSGWKPDALPLNYRRVEDRMGIEPMYSGFADRRVTISPPASGADTGIRTRIFALATRHPTLERCPLSPLDTTYAPEW